VQWHYCSNITTCHKLSLNIRDMSSCPALKSTKEAMDKILASEGTIILALLNIVFSFCLQPYLVHVNTFSEESLYAHTFSCVVNHNFHTASTSSA